MTTSLFILFCTLGIATLGLAAGRLLIERTKGDDCLHLLDADAPVVARQALSARRLEVVDAWGKTLTVLTVLAGVAAYGVWWLDI